MGKNSYHKPYYYVRYRWWRAVDREKVVHELKESGFDVTERELPKDEKNIDLYRDEKYEIIVKGDTLTAKLSAFKAVLSQTQAAPLTKKDMKLREMIQNFYSKDTSTPFPWGLGIEPRSPDDFQESMEKIAEQMAEKLKMVELMCICRNCPSYKNLGEDDDYIGYCFPARGKSKMIAEEKGCTCGVCPIFDQMKFMTSYFCTRDIDMKQKTEIVDEALKGHSIWDHLRGKK